MKFLAALLLLLFVPLIGHADTISVGGTAIELPNPPWYAPTTPQMTAVHDLEKRLVTQTNEEFIAYLPEADIPAALRGELVGFKRRFSVQSVKTIVNRTASNAEFLQIKQFLKDQNENLMKEVQKQLATEVNRMVDGVSKDYDTKLAMTVSNVVPFAAHEDAEHAFAYSMLMSYDMKAGADESKKIVSAATTTLLHIKGKILFLYCFGEEADMEWTRQISKQWSDAVLAANPAAGFPAAAREQLASVTSAFDWNRVGTSTIVGAAIGGIVGGIIAISKRKKTS